METAAFYPFKSYAEVLAYVREHEHVYYQAPLDTAPAKLKARVSGRHKLATVRVIPHSSQGDPFDADEDHLDRFRRPACGTANEPVAGQLRVTLTVEERSEFRWLHVSEDRLTMGSPEEVKRYVEALRMVGLNEQGVYEVVQVKRSPKVEVKLLAMEGREHLLVRNDDGIFVIPVGTELPQQRSRVFEQIATLALDPYGFVSKDRHGPALRRTDAVLKALLHRTQDQDKGTPDEALVKVLTALALHCRREGLNFDEAWARAGQKADEIVAPNEE